MINICRQIKVSWIAAIFIIPLLAAGEQCQVSVDDRHVVKALSDGNLKFALDLYKNSANEENVFLSPFSISVALAMTAAGADGNTLAQMKNVMHLNTLSDADTAKAYAAIINSICSNANYTLSTANKIYIENRFPILPSFIKSLTTNFKSTTDVVNFSRNPDAVALEINKWVEQQTNDKIKNLFAPGSLSKDTVAVLVNAIYFKGSWSQKFDERRTNSEEFHLNNGQKASVPMMTQRKQFKYAELPSLKSKMLEISYSGDRLVMYVILPDEINGLSRLQQQISAETFNSLRANLGSEDVIVKLPKFTLKYKVELNELLQKLGMADLFNGKADLSKITENGDLFVSKVVHQTFVAVDESGTTAAAATGVVTMLKSAAVDSPVLFIADHPFMFAIYDTYTNLVLFIGNVNNPNV